MWCFKFDINCFVVVCDDDFESLVVLVDFVGLDDDVVYFVEVLCIVVLFGLVVVKVVFGV